MKRASRAWPRVAAAAAAVFAASLPSPAADLARDDASQPAYLDGWQGGDNGGFGFGPWEIARNQQAGLPKGTVGIGTSTANGDAAAPTGDIDSAGGRAWSLSSAKVLGTPIAVRPLTGALAVGQTVSFDIDGYGPLANADELQVSIGNAAGRRWGMSVHAQGTHAGGVFAAWARVTPDTPEGMHVDFTLTGPDTFAASVRVLDGSAPVLLAGALDGAAGSAIDRLSFAVNPSLGPVDAFYVNNLAVTPEPGSGITSLLALTLASCRRLRRTAGASSTGA